MKGIYKFHQDYGRMGSLNGIFTEDSGRVKEALGQCAYFGEALGKHSDIDCVITEENVTLVSDAVVDVEVFERLNLESGFNPISTLDKEK